MAQLRRKEAEQLIKKILTEYARKIRSAKKEDYAEDTRQLFNIRIDAFYKLVSSDDIHLHIFNRLNDEGIRQLFLGCKRLAKWYELDTNNINNQIQSDNKYYSFHDGVFYIDARNTGVTISQIFRDVFPETSWEKDKDFYTDICRKCLGIDDPNRINGEYRAELDFDGNDETGEDNEFGRIMRQKYISDRFVESGAKGIASGKIILKKFDYKYGTNICKSENDNYAIQDRVYHELIPANNLIIDLRNLLGADILRILLIFCTKDIVSAMLAASLLYGLINPYIALLERKITTETIPELKNVQETG